LMITELQLKMLQLEELLTKAQTGEKEKVAYGFLHQMKPDEQAPEDERLYIDPMYRVAHLPIASEGTSKVYIRDTEGRPYLPLTLKVDVLTQQKEGWKIEENTTLSAFDAKEHTMRRRPIYVPNDEAVTTSTNEIVIQLPD